MGKTWKRNGIDPGRRTMKQINLMRSFPKLHPRKDTLKGSLNLPLRTWHTTSTPPCSIREPQVPYTLLFFHHHHISFSITFGLLLQGTSISSQPLLLHALTEHMLLITQILSMVQRVCEYCLGNHRRHAKSP